MTTMTLVQGDDWSGLYIDGKLKEQGHSFSTRTVAELVIAHKVSAFEHKDADLDWLADRGDLPQKLEEVQLQ
jgi:hypothetical protein